MNETTIFLSQLIGPIFLIMGIAMGTQRSYYTELFKKLKTEEFALFMAGLVEAVTGLAIVLNHNLWGTNPEIVISLLGWGAFLEGSLIVLGAKPYAQLALKILSPQLLSFSVLLTLILGGYLSWIGYIA